MELTAEHTVKVRFAEVDSMGVVWHGSYVNFLEDARETFGAKYGIGYMSVFKNGFFIPIVKMDIDYKTFARYEDDLVVKIKFVNSPAAKLIFEYEIINTQTKKTILKAKTIQVFTTTEGELFFINPDFFDEWKEKWKLA